MPPLLIVVGSTYLEMRSLEVFLQAQNAWVVMG